MSYQGYEQYICKNGHYWTLDAYEIGDPEEIQCPICRGELAWGNSVDLTNGSFDEEDERIDGYVKVEIQKEFSCKCPICKNYHNAEPTIYKIPKNGGHKVE